MVELLSPAVMSENSVRYVLMPDRVTPAMLRAYRSAMRDYINSFPEELRNSKWQRRKHHKFNGTYIYGISEHEKATVRYRAMIAAALEERRQNLATVEFEYGGWEIDCELRM